MSPRDPQGAETRTRWKNVYEIVDGKEFSFNTTYDTRDKADLASLNVKYARRIAILEVTTTTAITRHPLGGAPQEKGT